MSFTDGLDSNGLRWVRENQREGSLLSQRGTLRPSTTITGSATRTSSGFGLPPPSKFRSGHLPRTAIPLSAIRPVLSSSESDNDVTEESDEGDVYGAGGGGRYSLDSSPHDGRSSNYSSARRGSGMKGGPRYGSDYGFSDVSSSMETLAVSAGRGRQGNVAAARGSAKNGRYAAGRNGYTEVDYEDDDEDDDDDDDDEEDGSVYAGSSEFSTSQVGSVSSALPRSTLRDSEGYASSVPRRANVEAVSASKVSQPSAPPFSASTQEITVDTEEAPETCKAVGKEDPFGITMSNDANKSKTTSGVDYQDNSRTKSSERSVRSATSIAEAATSGSNPARVPTFHASALGPWHSVIAYDGCVRVCLNAWAKGCMEAPEFLNDECALLRQAFGIQHVLLQSEEELMDKQSSEVSGEAAAPKPKKIVGKMKVQVRRLKTVLDPPTGCNMSSLVLRAPKLKFESVRYRFSKFQSTLFAAWRAFRRIHVAPRVPTKRSFSRQSLAYVHASTQYIKKVSGLLKIGVTSLRDNSASYEAVQETYCCLLRMKSSMEEDTIRMQPGSGETHVFFPDSLGDDLVVEVLDLKGQYYGRVVAQVATIAEDLVDKLRWWSIYREPEHELVGKLQLYINYSTSSDDNSGLKCGSVAETVAYDLVLEVAMKIQGFQQRKLLLDNPWKWLLNEFAQYFGVSDVYRKLRYLSYIMDVATPTADCLTLVYDLLEPVIMRSQSKSMFSHQENRILGEIKDQIEQILCLVFENYKSLDESLLSGIMDVFKPATGVAPPALMPAVKLYVLLHDIFSPEAQTNLTQYFQAAARKRSRRHLSETDEFVTGNNEATLLDSVATSTAYQKMTSLCMNIKNEIHTDIEIHNQDILPSFIDLPNLSSSIYSSELCSRLRAFLLACPPSGPSAHVRELVIATSDFQRDLASWKIGPIKGGVDAKELFHLYIMLWIQDKRLSLLESCKLDKVKWSGVRTQHCTTPFVDEMCERLKETLDDYEVIICRWPEYIFVLENAIADVEKAVVEALDKQYADVLGPLKESMQPRKFGFNYVKKLTKRTVSSYTVPDELGILLNSMKRMLDVLHSKIEAQFKSWGSCIPTSGNVAPGERLSEVAVMLRAKFRGYQQAVVEKLGENTKLQNATKLKKILQDSKESVTESEIRNRMQPLREQLKNTITHLHSAFETHVFIAICRGYWDRMGQDVLSFLENRKENRSWYKGSQVAVSVLDDTFASQMQQLIGNALQAKELEPPTSIMEVHSMLCKDAGNQRNKNYYY